MPFKVLVLFIYFLCRYRSELPGGKLRPPLRKFVQKKSKSAFLGRIYQRRLIFLCGHVVSVECIITITFPRLAIQLLGYKYAKETQMQTEFDLLSPSPAKFPLQFHPYEVFNLPGGYNQLSGPFLETDAAAVTHIRLQNVL